MPSPSTISHLPGPINDELIEKVLTNETCIKISQWLQDQHDIKVSKSSIFRHAKANIFKFKVLVAAGMPVEKIIKHRLIIEAIGVENARLHILTRLKKKNGSMLAYLDDKGGGMTTSPQVIGSARAAILDYLKSNPCSLAHAIRVFNQHQASSSLPPKVKADVALAWERPRACILSRSTVDKWLQRFKEHKNFNPLRRQKDDSVKPWHELAYQLKRRNPKAKQTEIHRELIKKYRDVSIGQLRLYFRFILKELEGKL